MTLPLASVGAGLCAIGAGLGIGLVFFSAIQGMARQPEMAAKIQIAMFVGAALIEGFALFAIVICFLQMGG
ncbi:MAG: ATP synthase F0 subunit C [Lentisphaerota bacterium]